MQPQLQNTPYAVALRYPEPLAVLDSDPSVSINPMWQALRAQWQPILASFEGGCSQDSIKTGRAWIDSQCRQHFQ